MSEVKTRRRRAAGGSAKKPALKSFSAKKQDTDIDDDVSSLVPKGLAGAFVSSKLHEKKLRQAGLTPPADFDEEMPELPADIDAVDHSQLSNIILSFQRALSTSTWQASMAYIAADIFGEIAEYLENRALIESEQSNDTKRRAEAKTDDTVVAFLGKQKEAYYNYVRFRDLAKTIEGKVKVLSRVGGFKDDDNEASDRGAQPKPSRGAGRGSSRRRRES